MSSSPVLTSIRRLRGLLAVQGRQDESDEQLLHAFLSSRDDSAFAVLVRRHGPMVLHVCRRVLGHEQDAEDAFQATFLVLARNGASLRNKTTLASYLHGTAYRTALKAKQSAARRRKHEGQASARTPVDPSNELQWREVRTLLDEEIARLPAIYRGAFILCCLENLSRAEAAKRLGLKERTVLSRLAVARKRLGQRLARRGVELTAVLAASTLATPASALPVGLMAKTIEAALFRWACVKGLWSEAAALFAATTDAEGRFIVRGVGAERVFLLRLSGAGMAENKFWVVNREGFDPKRFFQEMGLYSHAPVRWSGPDVSVVAETEKIIRGVVAEADSGKGRPGVLVRLTREIKDRSGDKPLFPHLQATTDSKGRYEIHGARKAKSYLLEVTSDAMAGYLGQEVWIEDTPGYQPVPADIRVKKGMKVKIQDAEGEPLFGVEVLGAANRIDGDCCTICRETTDQPRLLVFHQAKRKLAGTLTLKAGEKLPPVVKLRSMGSVKGRLLNVDGKPLAGVAVDPLYRGRQAEDIDRGLHETTQSVTDATGAFTLDELIPPLQFALSFRDGKRRYKRTAQVTEITIQVAPGECRDLGTIEVKQVRETAEE